jgi:hypothetical protein
LFDTTGNKALAIGVHVSGHDLLRTNIAVPISFHMDTQENHFPKVSINTSDVQVLAGNNNDVIVNIGSLEFY